MLNVNGQLEPIGQLLEVLLHQMRPTAIAPSTITAKNEFLSLGILRMNGAFPPILDIVAGKLRGVFAGANRQIGGIVSSIIQAMRDHHTRRIAGKAVIIDVARYPRFDIDSAVSVEESNVLFFFVSMLRIGLGPSASASVTAWICSNWAFRSGSCLKVLRLIMQR